MCRLGRIHAGEIFTILRGNPTYQTWAPDQNRWVDEYLGGDPTLLVRREALARAKEKSMTIEGASEATIESFNLPGANPGRLTPNDLRQQIEEKARILPSAGQR